MKERLCEKMKGEKETERMQRNKIHCKRNERKLKNAQKWKKVAIKKKGETQNEATKMVGIIAL